MVSKSTIEILVFIFVGAFVVVRLIAPILPQIGIQIPFISGQIVPVCQPHYTGGGTHKVCHNEKHCATRRCHTENGKIKCEQLSGCEHSTRASM